MYRIIRCSSIEHKDIVNKVSTFEFKGWTIINRENEVIIQVATYKKDHFDLD